MFEKKLKEARNSKNISQKHLAKKLSLSQQAYAKYELGTATPNPDTLKKIANELDVTIAYLLEENTISPSMDGIELSEHEITIIQKYRSYSHETKLVILRIFDIKNEK